MRATASLGRFRAHAESRMASRVTIRRPTGRRPQDETTGRQVAVTEIVDTAVPFRLDGSATGDGGTRSVTVNGITYQQATGVGHLPATWLDLADNDLITIDEGEWAGHTYRVIEAVTADQKTARRFPVVEV